MQLNYNIKFQVSRDGQQHTVSAIDGGETLMMPIDADIDEGDYVSRILPNGRERQLVVTKLKVVQSPFGSNQLDHVEVIVKSVREYEAEQQRNKSQLQFNATNMQVATGSGANQTMNISQSADDLVASVQGVVEILRSLSLLPDDSTEIQVAQAAADDIVLRNREMKGLKGFVDWVKRCLDQGATAAVVAAVTLLMNGIIEGAERLLH